MGNPGSGGDELFEVAMCLLEPGRVTPQLVLRTVRRARRLGLYWRVLEPLERAVLEAAARARVNEYRSPVVRRILAKLIAKIEVHTMKGVVVLTGLKYALSRGLLGSIVGGLGDILRAAKRKLEYILYLGRNMLVVHNYFEPLLSWG